MRQFHCVRSHVRHVRARYRGGVPGRKGVRRGPAAAHHHWIRPASLRFFLDGSGEYSCGPEDFARQAPRFFWRGAVFTIASLLFCIHAPLSRGSEVAIAAVVDARGGIYPCRGAGGSVVYKNADGDAQSLRPMEWSYSTDGLDSVSRLAILLCGGPPHPQPILRESVS